MNLTTVRYGVEGGVATLTLDRPEARNAVNRAMCDEIVAAMSAARDDAAVQLVLIRANGPVFCAGADLKERKGMAPDEVRARRLAAYAAYGAIEDLPMPAIAIVHGAAVGSGCDIAAACDFVIATPLATLHLQDPGIASFPDSVPVVRTLDQVLTAFPGGPAPAEVVVTGDNLAGPQFTSALTALRNALGAETGNKLRIGATA